MNSSHPQKEAAPNLSVTNRKRKAVDDEDPTEIIPPKRLCFSPPTRPQNWSLPESIVHYIAKNPTSRELYQKLIRSCKYFFYKNPVIVCGRLFFDAKSNGSRIEVNHDEETKFIDLKTISQRFWVTDCIQIDSEGIAGNEHLISSLIPHIYRSDATHLQLWNQKLSFNEYNFFAANGEYFCFKDVIITNEEGSVVPLEKLFEASVKATHFCLRFRDNDTSISADTVKNLLAIPRFWTLDSVAFVNIPEIFDIDSFFRYIKRNKRAEITLNFSSTLSGHYKARLDRILDEILDNNVRVYKPPAIYYDGMDMFKHFKLYMICMLSQAGID